MKRGRNTGFTLPEVAISIVVLTMGLMALLSMQTSSAVYGKAADSRTRALLLAQSDMERMQNKEYSNISSTSYNKTLNKRDFKLVRKVSPNEVENKTLTLNVSVNWGEGENREEVEIVGLICK